MSAICYNFLRVTELSLVLVRYLENWDDFVSQILPILPVCVRSNNLTKSPKRTSVKQSLYLMYWIWSA